MLNYNKVILTGFVAAKPVTRVAGASTVTRFSLGVTEKYFGNDGSARERTYWARIVAWNARGTNAEKYLDKGSHVLVEGQLRYNDWVDKETQQERSQTEIHADSIKFLDRKPGSDSYVELPAVA
ncbi:MAG: single-stranded DNA-binding protein [Thermoanaerobaculia bacterium]